MSAPGEPRSLKCCVDGEPAGTWLQHWNQDAGWGICPACAAAQRSRQSAEEFEYTYGVERVNFGALFVQLYGRRYRVMATARNVDEANAYMTRTEGASVLLVREDGTVVMANFHDEGEAISAI